MREIFAAKDFLPDRLQKCASVKAHEFIYTISLGGACFTSARLLTSRWLAA